MNGEEAKSSYETHCLNKLFFRDINPALELSNLRAESGNCMKESEVYSMGEEANSETIFKKFWELYENSKALWGSQIQMIKPQFILQICLLFFYNVFQYAGPICLSLMLDFYEDPSVENNRGYWISAVIFFILFIRTFLLNHANDQINIGVTKTYAMLYSSIYRRLLNLVESSRGVIGSGRILNFFSSDATFISELYIYINNIWVTPLHLIIAVILLYFQIEWCAFLGVGMIIILVILQSLVMNAFLRLRFANQRETDRRTKILQEFLEGIRIVKYYGWEYFVLKKIGEVRDKEIKEMSSALYLRTAYELLIVFLPICTMIILFAIYSLYVGDLTVSKVYSVISIFKVLQPPLWIFVTSAILIAQTKASYTRVQQFFSLSSCSNHLKVDNQEDMPVGSLSISDGVFAWETAETRDSCNRFSMTLSDAKKEETKHTSSLEDSPKQELLDIEEKNREYIILKHINLQIDPGEIVAVVGVVGSGKSSLVNAMIGEMFTLKGKVKHNGKIAYISQSAWIMNGTLRENIIMDKPFDEIKYNEVLKQCELLDDLKTLPSGDNIEIGSKGINISGGQKQRISIARALYSDSDIYIIDDCLSALDPQVAKFIFSNVIMGALRDKTRIFVTHGMHFVEGLKKIIVMKEGRIVGTGDYNSLYQNSSEFKYLTMIDENKRKLSLTEKREVVAEEEEEKGENIIVEKSSSQKKEDGKLLSEEKQESGRIKWKNYLRMIQNAGVGVTIIALIFFLLEQACLIIIDWWVGVWSSDDYKNSNNFYIAIYSGLAGAQAVIVVLRGLIYIVFIMKLAISTQMNLVWSVLRAPLNWFDKTSVGRIMNRLCKDQSHLDNDVAWMLQSTFKWGLSILGSLILIGIVTYYFYIVLVLVMVLYIYFFLFSIQCTRDTKRIDAMAKSPIYVQFEETMDGLSTIRAYNFTKMFIQRMTKKINHCMNAYFMNTRCVRWLSLRSDIISAFVVGSAFILASLARNYDWKISSNMMGLALSQSLQIVNMISMMIMFAGMLDSRMTSVERIFEYIHEVPSEKELETPKPKEENWPTEGRVEINNLYLRYRPNLRCVIKGVSFSVSPKEKIGIVGRTGSGKSTMTLGMLRIMEAVDALPQDNKLEQENSENSENPENDIETNIAKNAIVIDGQDISEIGLHVLRKRLAIIPQDAMCFSGDIKSNLDPFSSDTEDRQDEMIEVLAKVKLYEKLWRKLIETKKEKASTIENPKQEIEKKVDAPQTESNKSIIEEKKLDSASVVQLDKNPSISIPKISIPLITELTKDQKNELLAMEVQEKGSNLSVGERQLLCIARAILRHPKVLLMDEATASIDEATDREIQEMIKKEFVDSTVITIAHRIKTIIGYDKILVLKDGELMEFDHPAKLLENKTGIFYQTVMKQGSSFFEEMQRIARQNLY